LGTTIIIIVFAKRVLHLLLEVANGFWMPNVDELFKTIGLTKNMVQCHSNPMADCKECEGW